MNIHHLILFSPLVIHNLVGRREKKWALSLYRAWNCMPHYKHSELARKCKINIQDLEEDKDGWSRVGGNPWPQVASDSKNTSKYYLFGLLPNVKEKACNFECLLYREHCAINFTWSWMIIMKIITITNTFTVFWFTMWSYETGNYYFPFFSWVNWSRLSNLYNKGGIHTQPVWFASHHSTQSVHIYPWRHGT